MLTPVPMEGDTLAGALNRASAHEPQPGAWRKAMREAITDPRELLALLGLDQQQLGDVDRIVAAFPLRVPRGFVARMQHGDAHDPLLRQVLPIVAEAAEVGGFTGDPLQEGGCGPLPGMLHKYTGRVLLVTTGACAVHCRYCFRRHFAYDQLPEGRAWWQDAVTYIAQDASISEVLLSGGDPLTLPDVQLARIADDLSAVPHVARLRLHTRLPVVLPERVDAELLQWLRATRLQTVVVIHANHPNEISPDVVAACQRLRHAGVTVLNQSVLLAGINDQVEVLQALSERLFAAGVVPYYLHQLDRVAGAAHFLVSDERAIALHRDLAARLPGYLIPRLVREEPGAPGKTWLR